MIHDCVIFQGATLHLSNVHPSDEGSYQCRAENVLGSVATELELRVQERPVLTVSPEADVQVMSRSKIAYLWSSYLMPCFAALPNDAAAQGG